MRQQEFEDYLRHFLHQEPFQPFVVEMVDGRVLLVEQPRVAFGGGGAGYVTPAEELVLFECEEVRDIRQATHEMSS